MSASRRFSGMRRSVSPASSRRVISGRRSIRAKNSCSGIEATPHGTWEVLHRGSEVAIENLEFRGARAPDGNGGPPRPNSQPREIGVRVALGEPEPEFDLRPAAVGIQCVDCVREQAKTANQARKAEIEPIRACPGHVDLLPGILAHVADRQIAHDVLDELRVTRERALQHRLLAEHHQAQAVHFAVIR